MSSDNHSELKRLSPRPPTISFESILQHDLTRHVVWHQLPRLHGHSERPIQSVVTHVPLKRLALNCEGRRRLADVMDAGQPHKRAKRVLLA